MTEGEELRLLACRAANDAGQLLKRLFGHVNPDSIFAKRTNDWVSEADRAAEASILEFLSRELPGAAFLTEEAGYLSGSNDSPWTWIIDPLDGTTNFLRGLPIWAVSIAIESHPKTGETWGDIFAGAIAIPTFDETFSAARGEGVRRNETPLPRLNASRPLSSALLCTGFPFRVAGYRKPYLAMLSELMEQCANIRRPGAVAVDLCYVATGTFDGFWELDLSPWDIAAGSLIIQESGGMITNFQGQNDILTQGDIVAGREPVLSTVLQLAAEHFPIPRQVNKAPDRN